MGWILLMLAFACFVVTFFTTGLWLGVLCLLLALGLMLAAAMLLLTQRVSSATRDVRILSPEELRALREEAQASANAASAAPSMRASAGPMTAAPVSAAAAPPLSPEERADALLAAARGRSPTGAR